MKNWQQRTRIALLVALVFGIVVALAPSIMSAAQHPGQEGGTEQWLPTPAALNRTLAGDCPQANSECLELCLSGSPTGTFECWPAS